MQVLMVLLSYVTCLGLRITREGKETSLREGIQGGGSGKFECQRWAARGTDSI